MSNIGIICNLWFNRQIQIGNKIVVFSSLSEQNINFVGQLFEIDDTVKPWKQFQEEYGVGNKLKFKWIQQFIPYQNHE